MPATSPPRLLPAALAPHTVESLYATHGPERPWIYWLAILAVISVLIALPVVEVDVTVRAPGIVRPATERSELRLPLSGQIAEVLARDNDRVTAGQPLLVLRNRDLEERLALNRTRQREKSALVADLILLRSTVATQSGAKTSASVPLSRYTPESAAMPALETPDIRADFALYQAQQDAHQLAVVKAARELARNDTLAAAGLITVREIDQVRDELASASADQSAHTRTILARWESRLRDEQSNLDTLRTEDKRLAEESLQATLRAPVTGSVQGLTGLSTGTWLTAGQSLGTISPDDRLLVETYVSSRDVGLLRLGQAVHLQIDAFSYTQWGVLDGTVITIAEDSGAASASNGATIYKACIQPTATTLHLANGTSGALRKGMTLGARFVVARRSLLQILYEDVSAWLIPQSPKSTL